MAISLSRPIEVKSSTLKSLSKTDRRFGFLPTKPGGFIWQKSALSSGTRDLEAGYHFHKNFDFKWSSGDEPEISFEVIE